MTKPICVDSGKFKVAKRFASEMNHARSVSAWCLIWDGKPAGSIVANWSDNPSGAVCTATVRVYAGPLEDMPIATGRAGGCGYCKFSAAVDSALRQGIANYLDVLGDRSLHGAGESEVRSFFESLGYVVAIAL